MDLFQNFKRESTVPAVLCEKYAPTLPPELLNVWRNYGFGTLLDGCLKIINPDEYQDLLHDTYDLSDSAIPVFATAFAGLLTWEKGRYLRFINYQNGTFEGVCAGLNWPGIKRRSRRWGRSSLTSASAMRRCWAWVEAGGRSTCGSTSSRSTSPSSPRRWGRLASRRHITV